MVIQHASGFPEQVRNRFQSIIEDKVGFRPFTLYTFTEEENSMGRLKDRVSSNTVIQGFLHKVTPQDKQFLDLGILNIGDGVFYAEWNVNISEDDEIAEDDETDRWIVTKLMENEKVQGTNVFQVWQLTKRV